MYDAICSDCGKECQVPFRPTGSKPVFCSECFEKKGGGGETRRFGDRNDRQPQNNAQLEAINIKLDKILAILKPTPAEPIEKPVAIVEKKKRLSKKTAPTPKK
jgi:CxxC-x17-CxxC domain-containing protein